ncbi:superantigen-like protein [Staphylococcus hyicus]|uniref:exotoxin beta-grasp domain-containing protein n=1 Tax=Staphylococcus hyicus TaxID=1284 RepID=UPI000D1F9E38|nr:superantigen-like protein [Staphylococcus hyicus]MCE5154269.1 superantigen-like protein [Staphylococcus hyicus]PTJ71136.1 superantigen-like protein [Staphylococcus hyicus]PTJ88444.1 superantigen-like protein [Staphylococcus hyicus]
MKLSTIAKSSLALGILTTGIITTHAQSANAAESFNSGVHIINNDTASLHSYYQQAYYELNNVSGTKKGNQITVKTDQQPFDITIPGNAQQFQDGTLSNIDVFAVKEYNDTKLPSIGGITQNNTLLKDNPIEPKTILLKSNEKVVSHEDIYFPIHKQHVSLKELDFKLRQQLIENDGLYSNGYKKGEVIIWMKDNVKHEIDLSVKFPISKMGTVIDATKIHHINVEMKS